MTTYADAITLLMAFFIMLVSFSKVELPLFEKVQAGIKESLAGGSDPQRPLFDLQATLTEVLADVGQGVADSSSIGFDEQGLVLEFASGIFFAEGRAELSSPARLALDQIQSILDRPPYDRYYVEVEGHTSDETQPSDIFPTNWELSAGRAAAVARFFIERGMLPTRLKAAGYADTRPKLPNRNLTGEPIPENQIANRRIVVRLLPNFDAQQQAAAAARAVQ
jgi:chemotaxis protein MotB